MPDELVTGSCLCGGVRFTVQPPIPVFRYCHCSRCRKASGSAHASNLFVPAAQFAWSTGEPLITRFDLPNAKRFSVWFCSRCGSRVPHQIRDRDHYLIPAGALDNDPGIRPENSIFWGSKAGWYVEPSAMPKHDEYS